MVDDAKFSEIRQAARDLAESGKFNVGNLVRSFGSS